MVDTKERADRRNGESSRSVRRRRALPGGRAVVGGFLVALAGVGAFAGYTGATSDTRVRYVVAREDLTIGQRVSRSSLGYLPMDLPSPVGGRSFRNPDDLVGAVVVGPLSRGELIQSSDVVRGGEAPAGRQVSFSIESARAVDGQLQRGEIVDVLVTYGTGNEAYTVTVARGVRVINRRQPRGALGDGREEVITVSVPGRAQTLALAHAVSAGAVTLVRTGATDDSEAGEARSAVDANSYQAPAPPGPGRADDEAQEPPAVPAG